MTPRHNKLMTCRIPVAKRVYPPSHGELVPPSADSGQVPEMKEDKLTEVLVGAGLPSLRSGQAHKGSRPYRKSKFKRGLKKTPF